MYTTTTKSRENMYPKNVLGRYEVIPKNSIFIEFPPVFQSLIKVFAPLFRFSILLLQQHSVTSSEKR